MKRKIILLIDGYAAHLVKENLSNVQNRIFAASISGNKKKCQNEFRAPTNKKSSCRPAKVNGRNSIGMIWAAWQNISSITIKNCWKNTTLNN